MSIATTPDPTVHLPVNPGERVQLLGRWSSRAGSTTAVMRVESPKHSPRFRLAIWIKHQERWRWLDVSGAVLEQIATVMGVEADWHREQFEKQRATNDGAHRDEEES